MVTEGNMQAIILAAGMGKRLKELTANNTKCMVKVNGIPIIERLLFQLEKVDLSRIVIVVGYKASGLIDYIKTLDIHTPIYYVENPVYDKTNNIYSLSLAKEYMIQEDTLLFESDIVFEDSVLNCIIEDPRDTLALVDKYEPWMDGTCLKIDAEDNIIDFISGKNFDFNNTMDCYKTVNIYKFSKHFSKTYYLPFLSAYQTALGENEYYEQVLKVIAMLDEPIIKAKRINGLNWYEIDDLQDLDIAESIFAANDDQKTELIKRRYGGYWRYPKMLDFCYLVNPYFPPQKMKDELKASFERLLTEYPSGMSINSLLAAKNFSVHQENIVVGNGAAELIKCIMEMLEGRFGFIRPTFEEYPNRYDVEQSVIFSPANSDYSYTSSDLIRFFDENKVDNLVLINPDNPSGNYIPKKDLLSLIKWSQKRGIRLIVDESFADFADEEDSTFIDQEILNSYLNLYVMKSISKSYGVPGLRLGVFASGDTDTIAKMKKNVAIWNINSFAEFYMQIEEKYKKDYSLALSQIKCERRRFEGELKKLEGIRVIPSQANYVMIELVDGYSAKDLTVNLLNKHNILVKDLTDKLDGKDYLRLAIRNSEENNILLDALRRELNR